MGLLGFVSAGWSLEFHALLVQGLSRPFRPDNHYLCGQIWVLCFSFQVLIKMLQTPYLSSSCCKMLLNTISAFLLAENVLLPDSLTKEAIQKVTRIAAYARNPRLQIPWSRVISGHSISGWEICRKVPFSLFAQTVKKLPNALNKVWWGLGITWESCTGCQYSNATMADIIAMKSRLIQTPTASVEKGRRTEKEYVLPEVIKQIIESNLVKKIHF